MSSSIAFAPLLPWPAIIGLATVAAFLLLFAAFRRARGILWRTIAFTVLTLALLNPRLVQEETDAQPDVAVIIADTSPSQSVGERRARLTAAREDLEERLAGVDDLEVRVREAGGAGADGSEGTPLMSALNKALAEVPAGRFAGAILITDGQAHDAPEGEAAATVQGPVHVFLTGDRGERDRQLIIETVPSYGIVDKEISIAYRIEDHPADAEGAAGTARIELRRDGEVIAEDMVPVGVRNQISMPLEHAGPTVVEIEVEAMEEELSTLNNRAVVNVNGVRDRLRVLLVSGQPHAGERTWRNLLKSDPAVDLVHFTILRPPEKDDFTPLRELALIAFPVQELFEEKLYDFDLIVFDRYIVRDVLPPTYFENIGNYVREGGAVLLAVGPEFAGMRSLYRTPLSNVLPAEPSGEVHEGGFRPLATDDGRRHPVTSDLIRERDGEPTWGRWFRQIEATTAGRGVVLLNGYGSAPVMILDRVGEGRVAQVMSDHIWLWARGYEGGGPHAEVIRRLAHWLMKEPDLEEEALRAVARDGRLTIERRSLDPGAASVIVTSPSGATETIDLSADANGLATVTLPVTEPGLYRVEDGERVTLAAVGALNAPELADLRGTEDRLAPLVEASGGGFTWLADETLPQIRRTQPGRDTAGRGWIGLVRNGAELVTGINQATLLPWVLALLLMLGGLTIAWWREGR